MASSSTISPTPPPSLSSNDSAVLQALFDAESSPSSSSASGGGIQIDTSLTQKLPNISNAELERLQALERDAISPLQKTGGEEGEDKISRTDVLDAISKLTAIMAENPTYPSVYINRAQALRMLLELPTPAHSTETSSDETENAARQLFTDLADAITLLTPSPSSSATSTSTRISPFHANLLATAYTHRAYILYTASQSPSSRPTTNLLPPNLQRLSPNQLEDMASADFALAGQLGSEVSRRLAVKTNPYAKMCGAIVKETLREEIGGGSLGSGDGNGRGFVGV